MTHYVYRLHDSDGGLLYVGCTSSVERRINEHLTAGTGGGQRIAKWTETAYPTRDEALLAEAAAIRDERPEVNIRRGTAALGMDLGAIASRPARDIAHRAAQAVALAAMRSGFTSVTLAAATGIPGATLRRRLMGSPFTVAELAAIAGTLGTTVSDLIGEDAA